MKIMRALAFPVVGLLFAASGALGNQVVGDETGSSAGRDAGEGLQAVGRLFEFLGSAGTDMGEKLDEAGKFIKLVIKSMHPDTSAADSVIAAIDAVIGGEKESAKILEEMDKLAARMDEPSLGPEEDLHLRVKMHEWKDKLKEVTRRSATDTLAAYGITFSDPVPGALKSYLDIVVTGYVDKMTERFNPYL
ncbi:hypothetical protein, conserved [Eimeria acervulina]|uniref:Uncharacterized protein n=1 Tax=Eimeria acervulina TaxID=5801 RepID=U6GRW9_EIMAC|nr:hypothetical protein, conserved [Eimeria acervulina]CDI82317.1 hypothetical protein, conserved [Eimeria acervulina]